MNDIELFDRIGFYRSDKEALEDSGCEVVCTNSPAEVWRARPQILVGYFYTKSLAAATVARLRGATVVLTGGADSISPKLASGFSRLSRNVLAVGCALVANAIVLPSEEDLVNFQRLCRWLPRRLYRFSVSPHVVTTSRLATPRRPLSPYRFKAVTICWLGTVGNARRKGLDRAVKLVAGLAEQGIDASLTVLGTGGPGADDLLSTSEKLGVRDRVHFVGPVSEEQKLMYFAEDDVYLQLSRHEGFGVAAAEALLAGMPVIHTNEGGLKEAVGDAGLTVDGSSLDEDMSSYANIVFRRFLEFHPDGSKINARRDAFEPRKRAEALLAPAGLSS